MKYLKLFVQFTVLLCFGFFIYLYFTDAETNKLIYFGTLTILNTIIEGQIDD